MRQAVIALNPRNAGDRHPEAPYRDALRQAFPSEIYRQRWHAEGAFSQHKRRLGSALTARAEPPRSEASSSFASSPTTSPCSRARVGV
jgi:hypothetical protein